MANSLKDQIMQVLKEYTDEVEDELEIVVDEVAKETVQRLNASSPKRKGRYSKSWRVEKRNRGGHMEVVIYNSKHSNLTHLLENGHLTRTKKRFVKAKPHIAEAEEWAKQEIIRRTQEVLAK